MSSENPPLQPATLARAVVFAFTCLVVPLSYFTLHGSLLIPQFNQIYRDIFADHSMPAIFTFASKAAWFFILLSALIPVGAIALNFIRRPLFSLNACGILALLCVALIIFYYHILWTPVSQVIGGMSELPQYQ